MNLDSKRLTCFEKDHRRTQTSMYMNMCACVLWLHSMFPASTLLWAYSSCPCVRITCPLSCLPSFSPAGSHTIAPVPSASPHSVPSPNKWHQYLQPSCSNHISISINSPQTPFPLQPDCRLPCTVDQRVLLFFSNIYFDFYLRIAWTAP